MEILKGYTSIKYVALFAGIMGLLVGVAALVRGLRQLDVQTGAPASDNALVLVSLAFVTICLLGVMAAATLKAQAGTQIADLERRLSAGQRAN